MSARRAARRDPRDGRGWWEALRLTGLLQLAFGLYLFLCLTGPAARWLDLWRGAQDGPLLAPSHPGGPVGAAVGTALRAFAGALWQWGVPLLLTIAGAVRLASGHGLARRLVRRWWPAWLATAAWLAQPAGPLVLPAAADWGGAPGWLLGRGFAALFGPYGAGIFLSLLALAGLSWALWPVWEPLALRVGPVIGAGLAFVGRRLAAILRGSWQLAARAVRGVRGGSGRVPALRTAAASDSARSVDAPGETAPKRRRQVHLDPAVSDGSRGAGPVVAAAARGVVAAGDPEWPELEPQGAAGGGPVPLPDLGLLHDATPESVRIDPAALNGAADLLEGTLRSFGVEGEVKDVRPGPVVTTFEYQPAAGIKVTQIVQRADDLALAMRARSIRMEAPIPGKAAVGIEIPNPQAQIVRLKEVLVGAGERLNTPLSVVLGKDVVGQPVVIDLAAQPHLLVAGSTGSGKSVCLNAIICNLLLRNDPSRVRLVLIDPKMLEMSVYNGIPHLLLPVVTDPKEALRALKWMEAQMDHRYRRLARHSVRNIEGYNTKVARGEIVTEEGEKVTEPMPYYLTIVDELADLMMQLGQDFELPITRLAQKARAVGIHLILATQRPSVDVLTGVIKANIPCRIAFRVIQKNDSRTILDLNGAERLLGHGDMLYLQPGRALPVRVHGAFLELEECEAIVTHWRRFADLTRPVQLAEEREGGESDVRGEDDLFEAAKRVVVLHQSGSTSLLQRRLRVGYTRAGRLMDMLEEAGIVGPFTGSKARDVLLRPDDLGETADPLALEEEE